MRVDFDTFFLLSLRCSMTNAAELIIIEHVRGSHQYFSHLIVNKFLFQHFCQSVNSQTKKELNLGHSTYSIVIFSSYSQLCYLCKKYSLNQCFSSCRKTRAHFNDLFDIINVCMILKYNLYRIICINKSIESHIRIIFVLKQFLYL